MPIYKMSVESKKGVLKMSNQNFDKFKAALKKGEEERFAELQNDVQKVRTIVEKLLTSFFESTANQAKTNYAGLEMY